MQTRFDFHPVTFHSHQSSRIHPKKQTSHNHKCATGLLNVNHRIMRVDCALACTYLHAIALKSPLETISSTYSSYFSHLIRISGSNSGYCKKINKNIQTNIEGLKTIK